MEIKYHISPYPTLLEDMVVKIWEAQSDGPGNEVYTEAIAQAGGGGHPNPTTITWAGADKVVHIVRLYTAVSNLKLHEYHVEPLTDIVEVFDPIRFKIGDGNPLTPVANSNVYADPALNGLGDDEYFVFRNNYGYLFPGQHYHNNVIGGGFTLDGSDVFNDQEEFFIQRKPNVIQTIVNDSVVGKWFAGYVDVLPTETKTFDPTHLRKLIRMSGVCAYDFSAAGGVPDGYVFCFQHFGGDGGNISGGLGTITFNNAPLKWKDTTKSAIVLREQQQAAFVYDKTADLWHIVYLVDGSFYDAVPGGIAALAVVAAGVMDVTASGYITGDVPSGDPQWEVAHNKAIVGDYMVMLSVETFDVTKLAASNRVTTTWAHHPTQKANKFIISIQELAPEFQQVRINWLIIKL